MTKKLLYKEFRFCLHPTAPMMLLLSALTLTPNYPYLVMCFYLTLSIFFICLTGRENSDVTYTLTLPVTKRDIVTARFLLVVILELAQFLLAFVIIRIHALLPLGANAAGMDANLALLAECFLFYGIFHLVFFPSYYRDVSKVGASFVKSSVVSFLLVAADILCCYTLPLFRDRLDTPDPQFLPDKLVFLCAGIVFYALSTWLALRLSQKRFESLDIR